MADLLSWIAENYPGEDPKKVFAGPLAIQVLGPLPKYGYLKDLNNEYVISNVPRAACGSFAISYGIDFSRRNEQGRSGEVMVVLQRRKKETGPNGEPRYGALGGHSDMVNLPEKNVHEEQFNEACAREIGEELRDDKGNPIWDIKPERLQQTLCVGIDYRNPNNKVAYVGYELELTPQELSAAQKHAERMHSDTDYAAKVTIASHNEVADIMVIPLSEAIAMPCESFTYPHEYNAIVKLNERLTAKDQNRGAVRA